MFRAIAGKMLFEKRWTIFWWTFALFATNFLLIQLFPALRDAFSSMTDSMPPELAGWFGDSGDIWSTIQGYIGMEVVGQMGLVAVIFGILFSLSMVSADEQSGTILTQLSKPVSRGRLYLSKYLALIVALVIVMAGFWMGSWVGTLTVEPLPIFDLLIPSVAVGLLALSFASLAYGLAALGLSRMITGVIVGTYALFGYFIVALQGDIDILNFLSSLTPFNYYNTPNVILEGMSAESIAVLVFIIAVPVVVALPVFARRDLETR